MPPFQKNKLHMKTSQTGCETPCRQWPLQQYGASYCYLSSVYSFPHGTPCGEHYTSLHTHTHTKKKALFSPSVSHPHSITRDQCVVAQVYVPFSGATFHHVGAPVPYTVCIWVWRGANALVLLSDSSVLLMEAGRKSLSLATMWSSQRGLQGETQRSHSSSSTAASCLQLGGKVKVRRVYENFLFAHAVTFLDWESAWSFIISLPFHHNPA